MSSLKGGILIQLSTYNIELLQLSKEAVIPSLNAILAAGDFTRCAVVKVHGHMMSLVYARNVSWSAELADLPNRFTDVASVPPTLLEEVHLRRQPGSPRTDHRLPGRVRRKANCP